MVPAGYYDEEESDYDGFGDLHDFEDDSDHSSVESGYDEPTTSESVSITDLLLEGMRKCRLDLVEEYVPQLEDYNKFKFHNSYKPLQFAAELGKPELVEYFLDYEAKCGIVDNEPIIPAPLTLACSVLHEKVDEDHMKCAELLLDAGVDINFKNFYGVTALMAACKNSTLEIINLLLFRGAAVDDCDNDGWSALFYATNRGETEIVQALLKYNPDLNKMDKRNRYAYTVACDKGFTEIADILKPEAVTRMEEASMNIVVSKDDTDISTFLEDADPNCYHDVFVMLSGIASGMQRYARAFQEKKINLRQFLLMKDEEELKNICFMFSWHRQTMLSRIRAFHLECWYPKSLGLQNAAEETRQTSDMMKLFTFVATLKKQMFVLKVSIEYFEDYVLKFRDDSELRDRMIRMQITLKSIVWRLKQLKKYIQRIKFDDRARLLAQQIVD